MAGLKALLIDLSGTLHVGDTPIFGAVAALQRLRDANIPIRFCSCFFGEEASGMQFDIRDDEIFTSLTAARDLVAIKSLNPLYLLSSSARSDFPPNVAGQPFDSVVVGLAPASFDYETLNEAFRVLIRNEEDGRGTPLIATHRAKYIRTEDGGLSLGPGPFVHALEQASGVSAEIVGKPSESFFRLTLSSLAPQVEERQWGQVGIVGDDATQDLGDGAISVGLKRYLVKTGKYRAGDENKVDRALDGCFEDIGALVDWVLQEQ